jgi:sulfatase maturation enzyme AslB (radical SAM superfamily)
MPFFGAEYTPNGYSTPCCLLAKDTDLQQLRTDMLNQQRSSACQKCWTLEDQGETSDRQLKNSTFDHYSNQDIELIEQDCHAGKFSQKIIKLYTSNLCNSTCVTCAPVASSAWATLRNVKTFEIIADDLLNTFDYQNFVMLNFVGGEPLYEKQNFAILERLIDAGNSDCFISFTSNGSTELNDKQIAILSQFKNLSINLSIDGVGPVFEYLRYPLKWSTLLDNIKLYRSLGIKLSASFTVSNFNIFYYDQIVAWFKEQGLEYNHNMVTTPSYFSVNALPKGVKDKLTTVKDFFAPHTDIDDVNFRRCLSEVTYQDNLKNINIRNYLPDLVKFLEQNI